MSPNWHKWIQPGTDPECDFNVTFTSNTVNLYHNNPPPPPPPPLTVNVSGPSTWPAYQMVTVTALASGGTPPYNYAWLVNGAPYPGCGNKSWCDKTMGAPGTSVYFYCTVTDSQQHQASDYHIVIAR